MAIFSETSLSYKGAQGRAWNSTLKVVKHYINERGYIYAYLYRCFGPDHGNFKRPFPLLLKVLVCYIVTLVQILIPTWKCSSYTFPSLWPQCHHPI